METEGKQRGNLKGPTSAVVARSVRQERQAKKMDLAGLSDALADVGWPIPVAALSRLENGLRRIDVDDLMALSIALRVTPMQLLLNPHAGVSPPATGMPGDMSEDEVSAWASGEVGLSTESRVLFWEKRLMGARDSWKSFQSRVDELDKAAANGYSRDEAIEFSYQLMKKQADQAEGRALEAEMHLARLNESVRAAAHRKDDEAGEEFE